jgi:hypothetical protein
MDGTIKLDQAQTEKSSVDFALADSCVRLREVEHMLFRSDSQSAAGLLVGELRLLLTRIGIGISITRSATFSLLAAACKISPQVEK